MEKLKDLRLSMGLTQADLAKVSGITQAQISNFEQGKSEPKLSTVKVLAKALGVKPSYFID